MTEVVCVSREGSQEAAALRNRLTPAEREALDRQWFGPREARPQPATLAKKKRRQEGSTITVPCGTCGKAMKLPVGEYESRRKHAKSGKVYCSRVCGASSRGAGA